MENIVHTSPPYHKILAAWSYGLPLPLPGSYSTMCLLQPASRVQSSPGEKQPSRAPLCSRISPDLGDIGYFVPGSHSLSCALPPQCPESSQRSTCEIRWWSLFFAAISHLHEFFFRSLVTWLGVVVVVGNTSLFMSRGNENDTDSDLLDILRLDEFLFRYLILFFCCLDKSYDQCLKGCFYSLLVNLIWDV